MIIKITSSDSYDWPDAAVARVKLAHNGLIGDDRLVFEKRASASFFQRLPQLRSLVKSGEELIHLFTMGSTERIGPNRNGDGFRDAILCEYHPTFEKHARFYRSHLNRDPRRSYGRVVAAEYNKPMHRGELLVALFGTKEAAERGGGLVADKELDSLESDKPISVSMACSVSHDLCSYCHNRAPKVADYCRGSHQGGRCKAGGLKDNIGALVEIDGDLHHLHADNPDPRFFDISNVFRPADRIAYVTGSLQKAAGARGVVKSADLARALGVTVPYEFLVSTNVSPQVARLVKLAYQLADIEADIDRGIYPISIMSAAAVSPAMQCRGELSLPPQIREKFSAALRAFADERICLPLQRFIEITTGQSEEKAAATAAVVGQDLPGIFSRLSTDPDLPAKIAENGFMPAKHAAPPIYATWAKKHSGDLSLKISAVQRRAALASIRDVSTKLRSNNGYEKAAADTASSRFAEQYAIYKLAFLNEIPDDAADFQLTASLLVLQNTAI